MSCVLEGLRQWPYVLEIAEKLCTGGRLCTIGHMLTGVIGLHVKIRDVFLQLEPTLLHDIVIQGAKAADMHSNYTSAAVAILSMPLPKDASIPSEVQNLFIRMFDHAAEEPSLDRIKPIHRMLQGMSTLLLGLLSSAVLLRLEEHIFSILRNVKGDNQSLSLYCLAIMNTISTAPDTRLGSFGCSYDTQELLASTQSNMSRWTPDAMRQFFTESKSQKTMHLVVCRAMWACKATTGETLDERMDSLLLANEVITAVPVHLREVWRKDNGLVVRKLEEKILAPDLGLELRFQALCFMMRLTEGGVHLATVMNSLRTIVSRPESMWLAYPSVGQVDLQLLADCGVFDQDTTLRTLQSIADFVTSAHAADILESSETLAQILRVLHEAILQEDSIAKGAMLALDVLSCGQKLQCLASLTNQSFDAALTASGRCHQAVQRARNGLVHELCKAFLTAALSARQSTYAIAPQTTSYLLQLYAASSQTSPQCCHVRQQYRAAHDRSLCVEAKSTPYHGSPNWREVLESQLQSRARSEQEALTTLFTRACADLESRCQNIERPLQDERDKRRLLEEEHERLNEAFATLETETTDQNIRFNVLETERDQCIDDLEAARKESGDLMRRVDALEMSLRHAKTDAENTVIEARKAREALELEHATACAKKEGEVEELQERFDFCDNELKRKIEGLELAQRDLQDSTSAAERFQGEIARLKTSADETHAMLDKLRGEANEATQKHRELEVQVQNSKDDLSTAQSSHQKELDRLSQQAEDKRAAVSSIHEKKIMDLTEQFKKTENTLIRQLEDLREESRSLQQNLSEQIEKRDTNLSERQKKVQTMLTHFRSLNIDITQLDKLSRKCAQKDKQIEEADAMRGNLMAAMGISGNLQQQLKMPHRPSRSSIAQAQQQEIDSQNDPTPPTPHSSDEVESQQPQLGASFASNISSTDSKSGPPPKRAKSGVRRAFKAPSPARPRLSAGAGPRSARVSVAGQRTVSRQPLLTMSANRSPRKSSAQTTPSKTMSKPVLDDLDESTFDGSELFAGTPGERMLDLE